jgi:hypothetical protein
MEMDTKITGLILLLIGSAAFGIHTKSGHVFFGVLVISAVFFKLLLEVIS